MLNAESQPIKPLNINDRLVTDDDTGSPINA